MEEIVDDHNGQFAIDEDREEGKVIITGHNNRLQIQCDYVHALHISGHNNHVFGDGEQKV